MVQLPPRKVNDLAYFTTTSGEEERWFLTKSYETGDVVKFENNFFEFNRDALRDLEVPELREFLQSGLEGQVGNVFDGVATLIENPNPEYELKTLANISRFSNGESMLVNVMTDRAQSIEEFKKSEVPMRFKRNEVYFYQNQGDEGGITHFIVTAPPEDIDPLEFNPADSQWEEYFKVFKPQLLNVDDPSVIVRKTYPTGHNLTNGSLVEVNLGLAEAVINDGEIKGFNVVKTRVIHYLLPTLFLLMERVRFAGWGNQGVSRVSVYAFRKISYGFE